MYNFAKQDIFNRCQRSFNMSETFNEDFVNLIRTTRDEFINNEGSDMYSFIITHPVHVKLIHSCAIYEYESDKLAWKTNTQVLAPMVVMCLPKSNNDIRGLAQIGRLQTKLGMLAVEHGYVTGYCLCFNTRAMASWNSLSRFVHTDPNTGRYIRPITLSIGNPLDSSKPHNWSYIHDKVHPSHTRKIDTNITIRPYPEV